MSIKEERELERRKKRRHKVLGITVLVFLILLATAGFSAWYFFRVQNVVVEGNELYDDTVIKEAVLNDKYSWNSLYVFFKYKFKKPEEIPFVDTVEVTLDSPKTLHIKVYEKGIMGYFEDEKTNSNVYFDKDGVVVEISQRVISQVPMIKGLEYDDITLYKKLSIDDKILSNLITLTQIVKRSSIVPDSIIFGRDHSPILVYNQVWVQLGSMNQLSLKVTHLKEILPKLKEEKGILHLENWTEDSTNIVFDREQ